MNLIRLALAAALLTGCVWTPTDDGTVETRLATVGVTGFAMAPNDTLQVRAWNYDRAAWELVKTAVSETQAAQAGVEVPLYPWSGVVFLGDRYWKAGASSCSATVLARVQVRERYDGDWNPLKTFDSAGHACVLDELHADPDYYEAGAACFTGDEVRLHAPPACVIRADIAGPSTYLTVSDDVTAYQRNSPWYSTFATSGDIPDLAAGKPIRLRADSLDIHGPGGAELIYTTRVSCRSASGVVSTLPPVSGTRTRLSPPTALGMSMSGTVGTAIDLSSSTLAAACPTGATATRIVLEAGARSLDFSGAPLGPTVSARFEMWL